MAWRDKAEWEPDAVRSALKTGSILVADQDLENQEVSDKTERLGRGYSLDELYRRYRNFLVSYIGYQFGGRENDVEETIQQVFANIAASHDPGTIENPKAFLRRAAMNVIVSRRRKEQSLSACKAHVGYLQSDGEKCHITPERHARNRELLNQVWQILRQMPQKRRQVFILHRIDGIPCAAIGRRLNISPSAAKKHLYKAIRDLDEGLASLESDAEE